MMFPRFFLVLGDGVSSLCRAHSPKGGKGVSFSFLKNGLRTASVAALFLETLNNASLSLSSRLPLFALRGSEIEFHQSLSLLSLFHF